jgi:hypothetical protein
MPVLLTTFFDFSADNVSSTLGYTKGLIGDFTPILIPIIAISLGIIIIWGIVSAIKR